MVKHEHRVNICIYINSRVGREQGEEKDEAIQPFEICNIQRLRGDIKKW